MRTSCMERPEVTEARRDHLAVDIPGAEAGAVGFDEEAADGAVFLAASEAASP